MDCVSSWHGQFNIEYFNSSVCIFFFLIYTRCIICVVTAVSSLSAVLVFFWSLNLKGSGHILEVVL